MGPCHGAQEHKQTARQNGMWLCCQRGNQRCSCYRINGIQRLRFKRWALFSFYFQNQQHTMPHRPPPLFSWASHASPCRCAAHAGLACTTVNSLARWRARQSASPLRFSPLRAKCMVLAGLPSMAAHFAHGHARLNAREVLGRQHLAHPGQLAIGPQRDHVIDLAGGLAVVLKGAGTAWLLPDHFRGAEAVAHARLRWKRPAAARSAAGVAPRCGKAGFQAASTVAAAR